MISVILTSWWAKLKSVLPPRPVQPDTHTPDKAALNLLSIIIAAVLAWHFSIAHIAIALFSILPLLLKLAFLNYDRHSPSRWVMTLLTVLSIGLILVFYGGWNGQTAGISFVVLLVSLKYLESNSLRDYLVVCIILYFLAACAFLFNSSIIAILAVGIMVIAITAAMQILTHPASMETSLAVKSSARLLAIAIPLAILLFFFFPRIQGDFGFLPSQDERKSNAGIEDSLVAGELAASAFDRSLAFRAEFSGATPPPEERYWRVKVLTGERNFQWEIAPDKLARIDGKPVIGQGDMVASGTYNYSILHESSTDRYLPYLDFIKGFSDGVLLENAVVKLPKDAPRVVAYSGSANRERSIEPAGSTAMTANAKEAYLATVAEPSFQMRQQLQTWRDDGDDAWQLAQKVLRHFNSQNFAYSLLPPVLETQSPLEDFFFNTQTGYCEHYASTFTTLMRWMDVPARVVVGYQGGEYNSTGAFLEVRYSDAHAWSEIWYNGNWVRVDPTAVVSPERIELGMDALLQLWDGVGFSRQTRGRALANYLNPQGVGAALRFLQESWANAGYQWNKWVVNYDVAAQRELLEALGMAGGRTLTTLMLILALGISLFISLQLLPLLLRQSPKPAVETTLIQKFKKHLRRRGIQTSESMTARELLERVTQERPELKVDTQSVVKSYESLRYQNLNSQQRLEQLHRLKAAIKQFKSKRGSKNQ